jgi:hypothetical protein
VLIYKTIKNKQLKDITPDDVQKIGDTVTNTIDALQKLSNQIDEKKEGEQK